MNLITKGVQLLPGEGGCQRRCQGDSYKAGCHEGIKERRLVVDYVSGSLRFIVLSLIVEFLLLRLRPYCLNKRLL